MKRLVSILLMICLVVSLAACGGSGSGSQASGGEMPDVFWMHINEAQKYMRADMLLNLNDYIAKDDAIDLNNYYEGIVGIYNYDGNQFALPKKELRGKPCPLPDPALLKPD